MTDGTLTRIRQVLLARLERKVVTTWAPALGIGAKSVRDWMDGIVCEGIAVAIAEQHKWDPAKGDFLHWAFLKAQAVLRKEMRRENRYQKAQQNLRRLAPLSEGHQNLDAVHEDLLEVLEQLPLEHKQAMVLFYLHGMTMETLSELLGKSPNTVYGLLGRARKKARKIWEGIGRVPTAHVKAPSYGELSSDGPLTRDRRKELKLRDFVDRLFGLVDPSPAKVKGDSNVIRTHSNGSSGAIAAGNSSALRILREQGDR